MGVTDEVLAANRRYAELFNLAHLPGQPVRRLAVVACMDARLPIEEMLGLKAGDAHIIRNAGGVVTDDVIRSLAISHHLLNTNEFVVINHTDCGMLTFKDDDLRTRLEHETGAAAVAPAAFHAFSSLEANVRRGVARIRSHPWIPPEVAVRGFVYDVKTGRLAEVSS